jgi:predicted MPP superfamily phosphohydrolase
METAFFLVVAATAVWAFGIEPRWLRIRRISLEFPAPFTKPLTLLHLSDTHFPLQGSTLARFFNRLSRLEPDLIFITGDIIDNERGIEPCARAVSELKARLGIYAVLGNHDHYDYGGLETFAALIGRSFFAKRKNRVDLLKKALADVGCRVLTNESLVLERGRDRIAVIGLDDPVTGHADGERAFANVDSAPLRILLAHSIDVLRKLGGRRVDLALGGHTHGGQFSIPFLGPPPLLAHSRLGRRYVAGLARYRDTITYTSRGMGEGKFFPFRFLCPPEAVLFEIRGRRS